MRGKNSFVLIYTLLALSFLSTVSLHIIRKMMMHSAIGSYYISSYRARMLALGGLNLAVAQLSAGMEEEASKKTIKFLEANLPHMNRWRLFSLKEDVDGIEGEVGFAISSEDGKVDLNKAFDFKRNDWKEGYRELLGSLSLNISGKLSAHGEVANLIKNFLKKRGKKIEDISQLLLLPEFEKLDLFYSPPTKEEKERTTLPLFDLFTLWGKEKVAPLFLSDSLCSVLGLARPGWDDSKSKKGAFKKVVDSIAQKNKSQNFDIWNILLPIYQRRPKKLERLDRILSAQFDSSIYTVLSFGKVGRSEQKLLAVLLLQDDKSDAKIKKNVRPFKLLRTYWL